MGVKGEGKESQADRYLAVNNTIMVTNHYWTQVLFLFITLREGKREEEYK